MFEQHELVQRSRQSIDNIRGELGERPTEANEIIGFLNYKTREDLDALEIEDRRKNILEVKKVLTKRGLMLQLEERVQAMDIGVQRFFSKMDSLHNKGLPSLFVINDKLITLSNYKQNIIIVAKDSLAGIQGKITGKALLETLKLDLSIVGHYNFLIDLNNQVIHKLSAQGSPLFQRYPRTVYAQFQKQLSVVVKKFILLYLLE
jgi:hypothetical protein